MAINTRFKSRVRALAPRPVSVAIIATLAACGGSPSPGAAGPDSQQAGQKPALTGSALCEPGPDRAEGPIAWYHDDYPAALACARKQGLPLVIDEWAPWCHTCLSMKQTVLVDEALRPLAGRFVWLAVDTDKPENAAVTERFPPAAWPTFFVVSPDDQAITARFVGGASVRQFREMLTHGERAYLDDKAGTLAADSPLRLLRDAHRAEAVKDWQRASELYGRALAAAPTDWPRRADVLVSRIAVLYRADEVDACLALGAAQAEHTGKTASAADFSYFAMACAQAKGDAAATKSIVGHLYTRLHAVVTDPSAPMSIDDRSDAYRILREMKEMLGDEGAAKKLAETQKAILDRAIREAPTPLAAMAYNWPAAEVYVYLDRAAELVPVLEASVGKLPAQYDPPYRLAWVYLQLERHAQALVAVNKALALAYGPRKARVQNLLASIYRARGAEGDRAAELSTLAEVVDTYRNLPQSQQKQADLERALELLAERKAAGPS